MAMKTRPILCFLTLLFLYLHAFSQAYDSLVVENAQWKVIWDYEDTPWEDEMSGWLLRGDTAINGLEYKKLYGRSFEEPYSNLIISESLYGCLREEVENKKIYARDFQPGYPGCDSLNDEYLLFDFSLAVGDTTQMCMLTELIGWPVVLTEIQNYYDFGKERKHFYYNAAADFIEGIGHYQGLMESPVINVSSQDYWYLFDYCRGTDEECGMLYVKIEENSLKNSFLIYPNPASDKVRIHFNDEFYYPASWKILLNDIYGICVLEIDNRTNDLIMDVSEFKPGMYFVIFTIDGVNKATHKLIISK